MLCLKHLKEVFIYLHEAVIQIPCLFERSNSNLMIFAVVEVKC